MSAFIDVPDNYHPLECDGPGDCIHCDRDKSDTHNPYTCELCDDGEPTDRQIYGAGGDA